MSTIKAPAKRRPAKAGGIAGKTRQNMGGTCKAFFRWCVKRSYLRENPLADLGRFDTTPLQVRRDLDEDELRRLLAAAPYHLRLSMATAICSGLRWGELRALSVDHLEFGGPIPTLRVDAARDKARRERHQRIPLWLARLLVEFEASGEAARLYTKHYARKDAKTASIPERPLLFVPSHAARALDGIAQKAGVAKITAAGNLDWHSCRTKFVGLLVETGADPKTAQEAARHATLDMTWNVYARPNSDRLMEAAERVGARLLDSMPTLPTPSALPCPKIAPLAPTAATAPESGT